MDFFYLGWSPVTGHQPPLNRSSSPATGMTSSKDALAHKLLPEAFSRTSV